MDPVPGPQQPGKAHCRSEWYLWVHSGPKLGGLREGLPEAGLGSLPHPPGLTTLPCPWGHPETLGDVLVVVSRCRGTPRIRVCFPRTHRARTARVRAQLELPCVWSLLTLYSRLNATWSDGMNLGPSLLSHLPPVQLRGAFRCAPSWPGGDPGQGRGSQWACKKPL